MDERPRLFIQSCTFNTFDRQDRYVIGFLSAKTFGVDQIEAEFASVDGEQARAKNCGALNPFRQIGMNKSGRRSDV
jgi:hypothetical protein